MTQEFSEDFFFELLDPDFNQALKFGDGLTEEQVTKAMKLVHAYAKAAFEYYLSKGLPRNRVIRDIAKRDLMDYLSNPNNRKPPTVKATDYLNPYPDSDIE